MTRALEKLIERMARAMCAAQNECHPNDGYCDVWWPTFAKAAHAGYEALVEYEMEPA